MFRVTREEKKEVKKNLFAVQKTECLFFQKANLELDDGRRWNYKVKSYKANIRYGNDNGEYAKRYIDAESLICIFLTFVRI